MDETREDLTKPEEDIKEETDATPEEAHRIGEFDDIVRRLDAIEELARGISEQMGALTAAAIDSGAEFEDPEPDDETELDEIPDVLDLDM